MSPEQARGKAVDKRADVWAFGVVLYEMLTGRRLFTGETVSDVLAGVLRAEVDWSALPGETPPATRRLLARCLERDPKKRLRDIGDALPDLQDASAAPASGPTPAAAVGAGRGRRTALLMAASALVAAAATFAAPVAAARALRAIGPVTFPVTAPPDTRLEQVVISPDGRFLAITAESASGDKPSVGPRAREPGPAPARRHGRRARALLVARLALRRLLHRRASVENRGRHGCLPDTRRRIQHARRHLEPRRRGRLQRAVEALPRGRGRRRRRASRRPGRQGR